jgi:hypothetical protein
VDGWWDFIGSHAVKVWIASEDLDADGMTNGEEKIAGTDPSDAASRLELERVARPEALTVDDQTPVAAGDVALFVKTIPGARYEVVERDTLEQNPKVVATFTATTTQKRIVVTRTPANAFFQVVTLGMP